MADKHMQMHPEQILSDRSLGAILVDSGKLSIGAVEQILQLQKEESIRFGDAGLQLGLLAPEDIRYALSHQYNYPYLMPGDGAVSESLVAAYNPFCHQVETLRTLRSQLMVRRFTGQANRKMLAIVSADAGEGRSFLAANLAIVFSQLGEHTLLIDGNLRKPIQHTLFKLDNTTGLSTVLAGREGQQAVQRIPSFLDLSVMTAGPTPPNPQELLGRSTFTDLLHNLNDSFDVVLIDTPPAMDVADAQMISTRAGAALVVVRKNVSLLESVRQLTDSMSQSGIEVVGSVLSEF